MLEVFHFGCAHRRVEVNEEISRCQPDQRFCSIKKKKMNNLYRFITTYFLNQQVRELCLKRK